MLGKARQQLNLKLCAWCVRVASRRARFEEDIPPIPPPMSFSASVQLLPSAKHNC